MVPFLITQWLLLADKPANNFDDRQLKWQCGEGIQTTQMAIGEGLVMTQGATFKEPGPPKGLLTTL